MSPEELQAIAKRHTKPCPECHGRGEVAPLELPHNITCPSCRGKGTTVEADVAALVREIRRLQSQNATRR